jgi:hypothetical protein
MTDKIKTVVLLMVMGIISLVSCHSTKKSIYTEPPPRTIPLDSVKTKIDPFRIKPDPDSFMLDFQVPGEADCRVLVNFLNSQHKIERKLIDSVYSPGWHKFFWDKKNSEGKLIGKYRAYYYKISICDSTYTKSFYWRALLN